MKNKFRIFASIIVFCMLIVSNVFATGGIITGSVKPSITDSTISGMGSDILGYIQFIGWGIAIGMLLYVGIKYMMASANEKANLKSGTINWIIGALIIGAASTVFKMVVEIFTEAAA